MKGAKEEGTMGFMKGLGKGTVDIVTKPGSGEFVDIFNPLIDPADNSQPCLGCSLIRLRVFTRVRRLTKGAMLKGQWKVAALRL